MRREGIRVRDMEESKWTGNYIQLCSMLAENMGLPFDKFKQMNKDVWKKWSVSFQEKFGYLSIQECSLAIDAATISEYENKPEHYHTFSADYVIKVFAEYKKWAQVKMNEAQRLIEAANPKPDTTPEKAQEIFIKESIVPAYSQFLEGTEDINEIQYPEIFLALQEAGLSEISGEHKHKLMDKAKRNLTDSLSDSVKGLVEAFQAKVDNVEISTIKVRRLAMTYACRIAFDGLKKKGLTADQLRELLCK